MSEINQVSLADYLQSNADVLCITPNNRVKCLLSGHEMPLKLETIMEYINSRNFKKIKEWYNQDFSKYLPYIVQHNSNPKLLHCKLTNKPLNKIPVEIEKHVNGKKFIR